MFIELFISPYVSILNFDMSDIEFFPNLEMELN